MTKTRSTFLALMAVLLAPMAANADLIRISFDLSPQSGTAGTGSGSAIVDSSLLGSSMSTVSDFANLFDWSLSMSGLSTAPSTTSFGLADLFSWILTTDAAGNVIDFNFRTVGANADNYGLDAISPAVIQLCQSPSGSACSGGARTGTFDIVNYQTFSVPEPGTLVLLGIGLLGIAATSRRRKI